jgi:hypothetical protein
MDKNINLLTFLEIGFQLHKTNKMYLQSASKRLLNGERNNEASSFLAKGRGFKKQIEQVTPRI